MANSATLCQKFVAQAVQNIRDHFPEVYVIHDMDDILLACKNEGILLATYKQLHQSLAQAGLVIAPENLQRQPPFYYLGHILSSKEIKPQTLKIRKDSLQTLKDFQKSMR